MCASTGLQRAIQQSRRTEQNNRRADPAPIFKGVNRADPFRNWSMSARAWQNRFHFLAPPFLVRLGDLRLSKDRAYGSRSVRAGAAAA